MEISDLGNKMIPEHGQSLRPFPIKGRPISKPCPLVSLQGEAGLGRARTREHAGKARHRQRGALRVRELLDFGLQQMRREVSEDSMAKIVLSGQMAKGACLLGTQ